MSQTAITTTEDQAWPSPRYAWYVLAVMALGYIFAFMDRIIVGLLTPDIIKDLGISDTQVGLLQGLAFAIFYTVFGIPLGWLADRSNRQRILSAGMMVWSVMTAACGLPATFWPLFSARVGVGIGEATLNPCSLSLIADYFPPAKRPKAFGFFNMATALASIISYLTGSFLLVWLKAYPAFDIPLIGERHPWQVIFLILGIGGLIPAVLFAVTVREPIRRGVAKVTQAVSRTETLAFLRANSFTFFCMMMGASLVILEVYATAYWSPTFFLRVYGWSPAKTGIYIGLFQGIGGIISAFTSGYITTWLKQRGHTDGAWITILIGAVGCTVLGGLAPLMPTAGLSLAMFVLKSIVVNYAPAGALTAMAEITPNQHRGMVVSLYVILTGLFAQAFGPLMVGVLTDSVFHDPKAVGLSIGAVVWSTGIVGVALLLWGRAAYRRSLSLVTWEKVEPTGAAAH